MKSRFKLWTVRRALKVLIALTLVAAAAACDPTWEDMTPWSYGPRCDRQTYVGAAHGQFTYAQHLDMQSVVNQWRDLSAIPLVWVGGVDWTLSTLPMHSVLVEKGAIAPGIVGSGWPGKQFLKVDPSGYFDHGQIKLDWSLDYLASPTDPSYSSGRTWRSVFAHEAGHALIGLGDLYDNDDRHPGVLMGDGQLHFNQPALGDVLGAVEKGCRPRAEKDQMKANLLEAYG